MIFKLLTFIRGLYIFDFIFNYQIFKTKINFLIKIKNYINTILSYLNIIIIII